MNERPAQSNERRDTSPEKAEVEAVLEKARQNVKHIVKRDQEGERITEEVWNLRLKAGP